MPNKSSAAVRAVLRAILAIGAIISGGGCVDTPVAPVEDEGYLAILLRYDAPNVSPGKEYVVRIREASGTLGIDQTTLAAPGDTLVMPLPLATYRVDLSGVPIACTNRYGLAQQARISLPGNTSIIRYNLACRSLLVLKTATDGPLQDDAYVFRLIEPGGSERTRVLGASDTLHLDSVAAGPHVVELSHVSANCTVTSDGGRRQLVTVKPPQAAEASFRIRCSDPAERPRILQFESSYHDGSGAFYLEAYDPDGDLDSYAWDITDCQGKSVLDKQIVGRRGIAQSRIGHRDTVRLAVTVPVRKADSLMKNRCSSIWVGDLRGNVSEIVQERIGNEVGSPPQATSFNASFFGVSAVRTRISASDPDGDLAGAYVSVILRDGVLGAPDGNPDIGLYNLFGYLDLNQIPDLPIGSSIKVSDVLGINVDLIDRAGNMTRVTDNDLLN